MSSTLLQLNIEACIGERKYSSSKMGEWKRPALELLLKLYKEHPMLYNMRHPKYYHKAERQRTLHTIIDCLEEQRPGTTVGDVLKKIQTMRTQFGQEFVKLKKAQSKGKDYTPTVWWYTYLSFLKNHIRHRTDKNFKDDDDDYAISQNSQASDGDYETMDENYEIENDQSEIVYEIQSTNSDKLRNNVETKLLRKTITSSPKDEIIYEITDANTLIPKRQLEIRSNVSTPVPSVQNAPSFTETSTESGKKQSMVEMDVEVDRNRSLGMFVMSQMSSIKDDILFFSTQMEVLNVINKAVLQQLRMDKNAS